MKQGTNWSSSFYSKTRLRAFSMIELIAAMSVLLALAIVAFAYASSYKDGVENSKRLADIDALEHVADSYFKSKNTYPTPKANAIPYGKDGRYSHDANPYGYSSFVSDDLFGSEFLHEVPRDPTTNAYYAYGKQTPSSESPNGAYDFGTVDLNEGVYYAYIKGNYDGSRLTSLIRAYNSPEFVQHGSNRFLPYDPYERKLTGVITSSTGSVYVVRDGTTYGPAAYTGELAQNDTIRTSPGSYATLYFADGSEIRLGDDTQTGTLDITSLSYKDRSIATRLQLYLREWSVWAKAPKLRDETDDASLMQIGSDSAVAAVRGTIFGLSYSGADSRISIADGKVEVLSGSTTLTTLTGGLGNFQATIIPANAVSISVAQSAAYSNTMSFTGGTAIIGPAVIKATSLWNDGNTLKTRKPDISSVSRSATGVTLRVQVLPEDTGRVLCFGSASGTVMQDFTAIGTTCNPMNASGSQELAYPDTSLGGVAWSDVKNPAFAICEVGQTSCSIPRVIDVGNATAFDGVNIGAGEEDCGQKDRFGKLGCLGEDVIAYAPFDVIGDLNMYYKLPDGTLAKLPVKTNGWHDTQRHIEAHDIFWGNPNYRKEFYSDTSTQADGNLGQVGPNGIGGIGEAWADNGVFISTAGSGYHEDGYLGYDFTNLNLADKFSIEIKVLGSALKRTDTYHFLWDIGGNANDGVSLYYTSSHSGPRLTLRSKGGEYLKLNSSCFIDGTVSGSLYCTNLDIFPALIDEQLYTIKTEFNKKSITVKLDNIPIGNIEITNNYFKGPQIYIGSRWYTSPAYPWGDTVSSVMITKSK